MRYKVIDEIDGLETYKTRPKRRLLAISIATLFLTTAFLMPSFQKVYPVQSTASQREAAHENRSPLPAHLEGHEPRPDQERFEEISQVLSMIETGQATLHLIDKHEIGVAFEPGVASAFYPRRNEIVIGSGIGKLTAALRMVHEVTHARLHHEGLATSVTLPDRQLYVQMKMEEELTAMVTAIEATSELWEVGVDISGIRPSYYYPYKQAYASAYRVAKFDFPGSADATLHNIGRAAGRSVVSEALYDGQIVTSLTRQTYLEYWGTVWDATRQS